MVAYLPPPQVLESVERTVLAALVAGFYANWKGGRGSFEEVARWGAFVSTFGFIKKLNEKIQLPAVFDLQQLILEEKNWGDQSN